MTPETNGHTDPAVPEAFQAALHESFGTIDAVRAFLKSVYEDNRTPEKDALLKLEKKLVLENYTIKKQSDAYYKTLVQHREEHVVKRTQGVNRSLHVDAKRIELQRLILDVNALAQQSMQAMETIPDLDATYAKDISNYDKLDIEGLYSRDSVLRRLSELDQKISDTEYAETFQKDLKALQDVIQQEKLARFKLYIMNKSLYTNRYKKLKDLNTKWSVRLGKLVKMEESIAEFNQTLVKISDNAEERSEDDKVLMGADDADDDYEEEEEEEEEEDDAPLDDEDDENVEVEDEKEPEADTETQAEAADGGIGDVESGTTPEAGGDRAAGGDSEAEADAEAEAEAEVDSETAGEDADDDDDGAAETPNADEMDIDENDADDLDLDLEK